MIIGIDIDDTITDTYEVMMSYAAEYTAEVLKKEDVIHIAKLADLNLSENEIERYTKDMQEILEFANMINSVNTEGMNETIASNEKSNVFRKDEVKSFKNREALLSNAPSQDEGMFRIPKVLN